MFRTATKSIMILLLAVLLLLVAEATQSPKHGLGPSRQTKPTLLCHVTVEYVSSSDIGSSHAHEDRRYVCSPVENGLVSDFSFKIELPTAFVDKHLDAIFAGNFFARILGGEFTHGTIVIPSRSIISVSAVPDSFHARRRRLATVGTRSLLVLRVSTNDATPDYSARDIYGYIFNNSDPINRPSLKSQYSAMSFGKLNFVPTDYGVLDVHLNMDVNGSTSESIRDATIVAVQDQYGLSSISSFADHTMFCIPPGTGNWAGNALVNSWRTVLNNQWCGCMSGIMHEIGHNLGLLHANKYEFAYLDFTSYMSAGVKSPYFPRKSFNGANNWQLGWYSDRQVTVDPSEGSRMVTLATFVDYGKINKDIPVLIKIGTNTFLQYNRAKDFNSQTQSNIDQVTIVQQFENGTSLLGGIDFKSSKFTMDNFDGSGRNLVIYACSQEVGSESEPDWMSVSIGYDGAFCLESLGTTSPTFSPSYSSRTLPKPTRAPTTRPAGLRSPEFTITPSPLLVRTVAPAPSVPDGVVVSVPYGMCFSETNTVEVQNKGIISMKQLRIGDMVKATDGKYTRVYSFGHMRKNIKAHFLQIHSQDLPKPIEVSHDHLLFVHGFAIPASTILVGDMIDSVAGMGVVSVSKIKIVTRFGVYAPFTTSGTIVVSGVAASSYVTLQEGSGALVVGGYNTSISMHWLAHMFQSPHRLACSISIEYCKSETYTEDGISMWVVGSLRLSKWLLQQNSFVLMLMLLAAFHAVLVAYLVELAMCTSFSLSLLVTFAMLLGFVKVTKRLMNEGFSKKR